MILAALRKKPPEGWTRVDVTLIKQEKEKETSQNSSPSQSRKSLRILRLAEKDYDISETESIHLS